MSHAEAIRAAIQAILDEEGDGWNAAQIVVCMSLERVTTDGIVETTPWIWWPPHQADWMTDGLLSSAFDLRAAVDEE